MASIILPQDLFWEAAKGKVPFPFFFVTAHCVDPPKDEWVTVRPEKSFYPFDTSTGIVTWVSTSIADSASGSGIRKIFVFGRQAGTNLLIFEVVTLNGTTPVDTVNSYVIMFGSALETGSTGFAVGTITAIANGKVVNTILPNFNDNQGGYGFNTMGEDGEGETGFVFDISVGSTAPAQFRVVFKNEGESWVDVANFVSDAQLAVRHFASSPIPLSQNGYGQLLVKSLAQNNVITGTFTSTVISNPLL